MTTYPIQYIRVAAYSVPTDFPESDGTFAWDSTTLVLVEAAAGEVVGLGFSYADVSTAKLVQHMLAEKVCGLDAMDVSKSWEAMVHAIRNLGRPGISSMAIAAVDTALWDLKAKLLGVSLLDLLGATRDSAPVYGSGGFTSYSLEQLQSQFARWVEQGIPRVKMKIGTHPDADLERVRAARAAIGADVELYVDANGAYSRKQALNFAHLFRSECNVVWFEEPVSSDDLEGLRLIRDNAPAGMDIAAGEYGYDLWYFRRMLEAGAVDVLQADATRCAGITGFMRAAALSESHSLRLSPHCAPSIHATPACAIGRLSPLEYFHDHIRIEQMFFDGTLVPKDGALHPDRSRPGLGLEFKRSDAARYEV